jgi:hypothetical protein
MDEQWVEFPGGKIKFNDNAFRDLIVDWEGIYDSDVEEIKDRSKLYEVLDDLPDFEVFLKVTYNLLKFE